MVGGNSCLVNHVDIIDILFRKPSIFAYEIAEQSFLNYRLQYLVDPFLFLDIYCLLYFGLSDLLMRFICIHGYTLDIRGVDLAALLPVT